MENTLKPEFTYTVKDYDAVISVYNTDKLTIYDTNELINNISLHNQIVLMSTKEINEFLQNVPDNYTITV